MAISTSRLASLLGVDPTFIARLMSVMLGQASTVLTEQGTGSTHQLRADYARRVVANPINAATLAAPTLAQSTNVVGTITMEDVGVVTSVTDAALLAQVSASWDVLSGVDAGN